MELKNSLFLAYDFSWKNLSIGTGVRYEYLLSDIKETYTGKRQIRTIIISCLLFRSVIIHRPYSSRSLTPFIQNDLLLER